MRDVIFAVLFIAIGLLPAGRNATASSRPNLIIIMADDLGWSDVSYQGSRFYETPHIDALAASGMIFTDAYANAPNCAPTRASLMSGQYAPRHGVYTVGDPWRGPKPSRPLVPAKSTTTLAPQVVTLAEVLKDAGYVTAHIGKWHLGESGEAGPREQGFDINVAGTHAGHPRTYFSPYGISTLEDGPEGEYLTDRLTDEALRFIEANRDTTFFLYLSHFAVHTPIQGKEAITAVYENKAPWHGQSNPEYAAMIHSLDQSVGRITSKLDALGLAGRTVVIFTSDNGGLGGYESAGAPGSSSVTDNFPLKGGKGQLYEGGIRVPLVVRAPGVPGAGAVSDVPVVSLDLYATLADLAGASLADVQPIDGESLVPVLLGGELSREGLVWFFPAYLQAYGTEGLRTGPAAAIRRGRHKLIWFFESDRLEFYNLDEDISERRDLAESEPEMRDMLHERLKEWIDEVNAPMPQPNPAYIAGP